MEDLKKNIYCDMDGVLADFNAEPNAVDRFRTEDGFFYKLKPIIKNVATLDVLASMKQSYNVYIITASPNSRADLDKIAWVRKYIPNISIDNIIICRNGQNKADFMKTKDGLLFDDYSKNIREWVAKEGNRAYQITPENDILQGLRYL